MQLAFEATHVTLFTSCTQLLDPSTPPTSTKELQATPGQTNRPQAPSLHPVEHAEHWSRELLPAGEYGVDAGHTLQLNDTLL